MKCIELVITGEPAIKKNSREIKYRWHKGRRIPFIGKKDKLKNRENEAVEELIAQKLSRNIDIIECEVLVVFTFYKSTRHKADLSNLYEFPQDCLQEAKIIRDDYQIIGHDGSRRKFDKANPRTEIKIFITNCQTKKNEK